VKATDRHTAEKTIMLKDCLIPTRNQAENAF